MRRVARTHAYVERVVHAVAAAARENSLDRSNKATRQWRWFTRSYGKWAYP